jgi:Flp pilus assembly protein TadG
MMLGCFVRHFLRDRKGNVTIIVALSLIPMIFLTGMALDYASATQKKVRLNAAADAAALAAVTPSMMSQSDAKAKKTAKQMFDAEASLISGLSYTTPSVTITDSGVSRTATVSYTAASTNFFPTVLGPTSWPISGSSQASSSTSPNIDFYLLLDNSPSMNIAATTDGINTMVANTSAQGGCAFACHESHPQSDNLGNPNGEDNYTLAKNLGVTTRIENMASATQALMSTASTTEAANNSTYRMAIYTFNYTGTSTIYPSNGKPSSDLSGAQTAAGNIDVLEVYANNWLTQWNDNNDTDTDFNSAMSQVNSVMPNPGTGASNSTPQEVLFLVTDGVDDKTSTNCSQPLEGGNRCQQPFDTTWCTTVKNRGIRIAVLYTEYLPLPTNSWYNSWISPFQSQISADMESCASSGLFFQITTDGDITAAMQGLFQQAVTTAHLTQ